MRLRSRIVWNQNEMNVKGNKRVRLYQNEFRIVELKGYSVIKIILENPATLPSLSGLQAGLRQKNLFFDYRCGDVMLLQQLK